MSLWGAAIAGGASLLGAGATAYGAAAANKARAKEAQKNRDFQKRMSNTSYRRAMRDMKKAGLNPILAYQRGGASTPGGSMALQENIGAGIPGAIDTGTRAAGTAITAKKVSHETRNLTANTAKLIEDANTARSQQRLNDAINKRNDQDRRTSAATAKLTETRNILEGYRIPGAELDAAYTASAMGRKMRYIEPGIRSARDAIIGIGGAYFGGKAAFGKRSKKPTFAPNMRRNRRPYGRSR